MSQSCLQCKESKVHRPQTHHNASGQICYSRCMLHYGPHRPSRAPTSIERLPLSSQIGWKQYQSQICTAETVSEAFVSGWISQFGTPSTLTTDRGRQFESTLWSKLIQLLGSKCIRTSSYHPIANGLIRHFHHQLKHH